MQKSAVHVAATTTKLDASLVRQLLSNAVAAAHKEVPNVAGGGNGVVAMHPSFYGCYDWHSAVHTHWLIAVLLRRYCHHLVGSGADHVRSSAWATLTTHLTPSNCAKEAISIENAPTGWELPYGFAWALTLSQELDEWSLELAGDSTGTSVNEQATLVATMSKAMHTVAVPCGEACRTWALHMQTAVRKGAHSNTAFSLQLCLDYARADRTCQQCAAGAVRKGDDRAAAVAPCRMCDSKQALKAALVDCWSRCLSSIGPMEPLADGDVAFPFLSHLITELDLRCQMSDVLMDEMTLLSPNANDVDGGDERNGAAIVTGVLDSMVGDNTALRTALLSQALATGDPQDKGECHLIGFNLSRAWGLAHIAAWLWSHKHLDSVGAVSSNKATAPGSNLSVSHTSANTLPKQILNVADALVMSSLPMVSSGHWMGDHWLSTFALRAVEATARTRRLIES